MAFRKRNMPLSQPQQQTATTSATPLSPPPSPPTAANPPPGTRPSPADGRPTVSTGTPSLDALLAGHAGLALGTSLLIAEGGATDNAGALLRCAAAQALVHGHVLHVVGAGRAWVRELPACVVGGASKSGEASRDKERMKIAWRYERFAGAGGTAGSRGPESGVLGETDAALFCNVFDLAKRLDIPANASIHYHVVDPGPRPFDAALRGLSEQLAAKGPDVIHRVVVPGLLSPALYPPHACDPPNLLQFLHALRSLLRQYPHQLTAMLSLPLELYPRTSGLVRWVEHLVDGVLELAPFPYRAEDRLQTSGAATANEEQPQGMAKLHKLPVFHERGGGGGGLKGAGDDMAFTVSRRRFEIRPFSLPPADGDTEAQKGQAEGAQKMPRKEEMEF